MTESVANAVTTPERERSRDQARVRVEKRRRAVAMQAPPVAAFAGLGLNAGAWWSLLPVTVAAAGTPAAVIGACMMAGSFAALPSLLGAGRLVDRRGVTVLPLALALLALVAASVGFVGSTAALAAALIAIGATSPLVNVSMNAAVQALESRGVFRMQLAHALFSVGMLAGSVGVGLALRAGAGRVQILAVVACVLAGLSVWNARTRTLRAAGGVDEVVARQTDVRGDAHGGQRDARLPRLLWLVGVATALALAIEISAIAWLSVHLHTTLGAPEHVAAFGPAAFAVAMIVGRLSAGRIVGQHSSFGVVAVCAVAAAAALVGIALAPSPATALAASAAAGIGMAVIVPMLFTHACRVGGDDRRGRALSRVTSVGWIGSMSGPAGVGFAAHVVGLRGALLMLAVAAAALAAVALALARRPHLSTHAEPARTGPRPTVSAPSATGEAAC